MRRSSIATEADLTARSDGERINRRFLLELENFFYELET